MKLDFPKFKKSDRLGANGFSMVELVVVAGIASLLFAIATQFYRHIRAQAQVSLSERLFLQMEARKGADLLNKRIRECSEIVRPNMGESLPYIVLRDTFNNTVLLYLVKETVPPGSPPKKETFKLMDYTDDYSGSYSASREKVLAGSLSRISFTSHSPHSVQVTATLANDRADFQFVIQIGLMSLGGLE